MVELLVEDAGAVQVPAAEEDVVWTTRRQGAPGKLVFTVRPDAGLTLQEGDPVRLTADGTGVFSGFLFSKRRNGENDVEVTAYDQLRYLKNRDTRCYAGKRADELVREAAADFGLRCGTLENTGYVIPRRLEDDRTLLDILQQALDETLENTGKMYVLYDEFGALSLRSVDSLRRDVLISRDTAQDFRYSSGIDGEVYNRVRLYRETAGGRQEWNALGSTEADWGVLQYTREARSPGDGAGEAAALLKLYERKDKRLEVLGAAGDVSVRAGCGVTAELSFGDDAARGFLLVEKARHVFRNREHFMDLTLRGGGFLG